MLCKQIRKIKTPRTNAKNEIIKSFAHKYKIILRGSMWCRRSVSKNKRFYVIQYNFDASLSSDITLIIVETTHNKLRIDFGFYVFLDLMQESREKNKKNRAKQFQH